MAIVLTKNWQQFGSYSCRYSSDYQYLNFVYYVRYQDVAGNPLSKTIQVYASCKCNSPAWYRLSGGDSGNCYHGVSVTLGGTQKSIGFTFKIQGAVSYPLNDSDLAANYLVSWPVSYNSSTGKWSGTLSGYTRLSYSTSGGVNGCYVYNSSDNRWGFNATSSTTSVDISLPDLVSATVTLSANPSNGGTVSGGGSTFVGASKTVTATPNPTFSFYNWTSGGTVVSSSPSYTFTVAGNTTLVANFRPDVNALKWYIIAGSLFKF